ncbi:hypothetical protein ACFQ34_20960 [Pseudonocardia benzenivorans]|uniref:SnoaL-like domain-containing protein n=2 Tax=Pseudonocardia TaxID=1847 RepID=F4CUN8_PSEUX|nr:hypothetical protein [Pseudonocardia dioxanivorans]AEA26352.1 hypothetical protein Psed_4189 [Pseudonocardia dioxanivorans CB1190]GJF03172.1 hypothetical protein PSD17_21330 [Pseudonocardia sp. D17]
MPAVTAVERVDTYLTLCEQRRLDEAAAHLAPGARLVFPGGVVFTDLPSMVAAAKGRYLQVGKPERRYLAGSDGSGATTVTCLGTLSGRWLDGTSFSGIRFVDVFVFDGDRIAEQHVFNDLSIAATAAATPLHLESTS